MTAVSDRDKLAYIAAQAADARVNVELESDDGMTLNLGPQHPATHGTLRIVARLDGEQIISADPHCGYMHRGYEKLTEVRTYPQVTTLINRIDWLGSFANEVPFILAAEQLMGVEAPPRAQWIRTILFELSRIANISLFLGDLGIQLGGLTAGFYAFRDREFVLNQIESATGGRFHPNFDRIGGLKDDLPKGWIEETHHSMQRLRDFCDEIETLLIGNEIFQARTRGIGVIPTDIAQSYGLSGANLRASGVDWDLRRDDCAPGLVYDKIDWKVWTHTDGDSFARAWIRMQEVRESTKIIDQLLDTVPSGPVMAKVPRIIKVPEGEAYVQTENPLGAMGYYVVSKGDLVPFRVKIRSARSTTCHRAVGGSRCVRARPDHDPRELVFHPWGHRPVTSLFATSIVDQYWFQTVVKALVVGLLVPTTALILGIVFLFKVMSWMQSRMGPQEAGPRGLLQLLADGVKFLQKEDVVPDGADRWCSRPHRSSSSSRRSCCTWPSRELPPGGRGRRCRHLLRPGRVIRVRDRHLDGWLGLGQQVLAHGRPARRRAVDRL